METMHQTFNKLFKTSNHNNANGGGCFTCEICVQPVPVNEKFKNMEASGCFHPYCKDCVAKYIETKVIHDNVSDINPSPNTNCSVLLDALSCHSVLPKKSIREFVHGRCFCPNRRCSKLILNECVETKSTVKRSDCPNCKEVFCFSCMVPWKQNYQCHQSGAIAIDIDMDRNDVLFIETVKRKKWVRYVEPYFVMIAENVFVYAKKSRLPVGCV
ncbi:hypothetical protein MKX03_036892 [Papaver bracteatum]|nr:hypothetical protein MKX03_036892 [Papaver bracteatum]